MNKIIFLLLFCCTLHLGFSQVRFGLSAGVLFPKHQNSDLYYMHTTWYVEPYTQVRLAPKWLVRTSLQYEPKKFEYFTMGSARYEYRFDYLHLPVVLGYYPIKRVGVSVGPELAYLLRKITVKPEYSRVNKARDYRRWQQAIDVDLNVRFSNRIGLATRYRFQLNGKEERCPLYLNTSPHGEIRTGLFFLL